MEEKKKWWKSLSFFERVAVILIPILVCVIVVTAIVIANKNDEINELRRKNEEITETSVVCFENVDFNKDIKFL